MKKINDPIKFVSDLQNEAYRIDKRNGLKYPKPLTLRQIRKGILKLLESGMRVEEIASGSGIPIENVKLLAEGNISLEEVVKIALFPKRRKLNVYKKPKPQ